MLHLVKRYSITTYLMYVQTEYATPVAEKVGKLQF